MEGSLLLSIYSTRFHYAFHYYSIDSVEDHYKMPSRDWLELCLGSAQLHLGGLGVDVFSQIRLWSGHRAQVDTQTSSSLRD
jgi:hypothetical protein